MNEPRRPKSGSLMARAFDRSFWTFLILTLSAGLGCWLIAGRTALLEAFHEDVELLLYILPRIILAMTIAGFAQVLLPREQVALWVGAQSGWRGLVIATVAGALTPGGPMASFPFVLALYMAGADRGALVAYLTSWSLLGFQRVMVWEIPLMGVDFALLRSLANLPLPLIAGYIARQLPGLPARSEEPDGGKLDEAPAEPASTSAEAGAASASEATDAAGEGTRRG